MGSQIKKIIIFGGGTSGWLTAAYMTKNLTNSTEICLIEDTSSGPIGVGEGTQPLTAQFLYRCGIEPRHWMKPSNASFKYGVELSGWNKDPYFVDNDNVNNYFPSKSLSVGKYFYNRPIQEYFDWYPAYKLAKNNRSPKLSSDKDVNFSIDLDSYGAVHFSAYDIIETIKHVILDKITYVDVKISDVESDEKGISKLIAGKEVYTADLYLDCSGFSSLLLEKTLDSEFIPYSKWLLCDSAVAMPTKYNDAKKECHPYTKATTMKAGWRWTIPTYNRVGNGYVYSSRFIDGEQAELELRETLRDFETPVKHIKMKCGTHKEVAKKNVCGVGLSSGFIEPLEATGITFTTSIVEYITARLNMSNSNWTSEIVESTNRCFYEMSIEIFTFVWVHYHFSSRKDTRFWKEVRRQKIEDLPIDAKYVLSQYYPDPKNFMFFSDQSMFSSMQWFSILHAGGAYKNAKKNLSADEEKYIKYFMNTQDRRVALANELFPNHHDFLSQWYSE
ncbi:MAG: hypothetical protein ACI9S8_000493 [Chlamydiales bacterium]|jgi:hypothetical protein